MEETGEGGLLRDYMGHRGGLRLAVPQWALVIVAAMTIFIFSVTPASAYLYHPFLFKFGPKGTSTHFASDSAIAVDQATHDVFVLDNDFGETGRGTVYRFTCSASACQPDNFTSGPSIGTNKLSGFTFNPIEGQATGEVGQVAIAPAGAVGGTEGDIYITNKAGLEIFSADGEHLGTIDGSGNHNSDSGGVPVGVATDPIGNLYIAYYTSHHIDRYVPSANPPANTDFDSELSKAGFPRNIAADSTELYALSGSGGSEKGTRYPLSLFAGGGGSTDVSAQGSPFPSGASLSVDPINGDAYLAQQEAGLEQIDKKGNPLSRISPAAGSHFRGVGVDAGSGYVYVSNCVSYCGVTSSESVVYVFGKGELVNPPAASINPVTEATYKSAHLSGVVSSGGTGEHQATEYRFACTPECPGLEGFHPIPTDNLDHEVEETASQLQAETEYQVTLIAKNVLDAEEVKSTTTFSTPAKPPVEPPQVKELQVSNLTGQSAHFSAKVNSGGTEPIQDTTYRFSCTPQCPGLHGSRSVPTDGLDHEVADDAEALEPLTTYHVAISATNAAETVTAETEFTTLAIPPGAATGTNTPDPEDPDHAVTVRGYVNPHNLTVSGCRFEYGTTTSYGAEAACANHPGNEVQSLKVRASAGNYTLTFGAQTTADIPFDATAGELQVALEGLSSIGAGNVKVSGGPGDPGGATPYSITFKGALGDQDVKQPTVGAATPPLEEGSQKGSAEVTTVIPGGLSRPVEVTMHPGGLQAGATYHFRLVASSAAGTGESEDSTFVTDSPEPEACPNEARRTTEQHAAYLPDCRAYELVSPPDKKGGDISAQTHQTQAAASESPGLPMAVTFESLSGFADVRGTGIATEYMAVRTGQPGSQGWTTHGISPREDPLTIFGAANDADTLWAGQLSADLNSGVFRAWSPLTGEDPNVVNAENLYLRHDLRTAGPGSYQLVSPCPLCAETESPLPPFSGQPQVPYFAGASSDYSHLIVESTYALAAGATAEKNNLYEFTGGMVRFAGLVPTGGAMECSDSECVPAAESIPGQGVGHGGNSLNPIAADGSRVFFTAEPKQTCSSNASCGRLYMREDGTRTVQINASELAEPKTPQAAIFWTASSDGSRVFFTTSEQLTEEDTNSQADLYMWQADAPAGNRLTLLSADGEPGDPPGGVTGVIGASEDGHYVYFIARGQLVPGQAGLEFGPAIYEWHDGDLSYIGKVTGDDTANLTARSSSPQARVSPDGRNLLFASRSGAGLTGYDQQHCGNGCLELYTYSDASHTLRCASCQSSGAPATASATTEVVGGGTGAANTAWALNRPLSADGRHVFFTTAEALVSRDTNGVNDAYAYDTETGRIHLLSSGTSGAESFFLNASADGGDVFLLTRQSLLGWDIDENYDLYDARVGGGLPEPSPQPAPCLGESCREGASPNPPVGANGTAQFFGPTNPPIKRPCAKGKVRRHGHCVRRHHKQRHKRHATARRSAAR